MKKVLQLNGSAREEGSMGLLASNYLISKMNNIELTSKNIFEYGFELYSKNYMADYYNPNRESTSRDKEVEKVEATASDDIKNNDVIVLNTPMYNFSYPAQVKMWLDGVLRLKSYDNVEKVYVILTAGGNVNSETGMYKSLVDAMNYAGLSNDLTIIPVPLAESKTKEDVYKIIDSIM